MEGKMNRLELHGLTGSAPTAIHNQKSQQDASISTYAANFFKGLNERAVSFVKSLPGRVSDFAKDLKSKFEADLTVVALKNYFQGLLNTPLSNDPKALDTLETRLAALGEFINDETLKANRSLANLFYKTRAELLSRILGENKTEIVATTDDLEKVHYLDIAGTKQNIETPQEIIAHDVELLKARTTAQKVWDFVCSCTFGSNAKKALSLHNKNMDSLKKLLRPKHEEVMKSLHALVLENSSPEEFQARIHEIKPEVWEFLKSGNPFQKETRAVISDLVDTSKELLSLGERSSSHISSLLTLLHRPSDNNTDDSRSPTASITDSDSEREGSPSPIETL
jgi:hypothetical protein